MGKKLLAITVLIMVLGIFLNIVTHGEKEHLPEEPQSLPQTHTPTSELSKKTFPSSPEPSESLTVSDAKIDSLPQEFESPIPPWEIYSKRVYEDVRLTNREIVQLNTLNGQSQQKLYMFIQEIENSPGDREEALNKALEQIAVELEKARIKILGESRYQILMQEKKKYAEEAKRLTGVEHNTEAW